jgi:hypothetical protein
VSAACFDAAPPDLPVPAIAEGELRIEAFLRVRLEANPGPAVDGEVDPLILNKWRSDSSAVENALAAIAMDVFHSSEELATRAAIAYRAVSGRLAPLWYQLGVTGDETRRYLLLAAVSTLHGQAERQVVRALACDASVMLAYARELKEAGRGNVKTLPERMRWPKRELRVIREANRLTGDADDLIQALCRSFRCHE